MEAALGYFNSVEIKFACNGVVISEYFVLTTAYCVNEMRVQVEYVQGGPKHPYVVLRVPTVVLLGSVSINSLISLFLH